MYQMDYAEHEHDEAFEQQGYDEYDDIREDEDDGPPVLDAHASISYANEHGYYETSTGKRKSFDNVFESHGKYLGVPHYDPEEFEHALPEEEGMPYCNVCERVIKSWNSYEYHVLKKHLNYKPYRCLICGNDQEFHTEDEGRHHMKIVHSDVKDTPLIKMFNAEKDAQMLHIFENVLRMRDDSNGLNSLVNEMKEIETHTTVVRNQKMKFGLPSGVLNDSCQRDVSTQGRVVTHEDRFRSQPLRSYEPIEENSHLLVYGEKSETNDSHVMVYTENAELTDNKILIFPPKTEVDERKVENIFNTPGPSDRHFCEEELDDNVLS